MRQISEGRQAKLYAEKVSAFMLLLSKCRYYQSEGFKTDLIIAICRKKAEFIVDATTKKDPQTINLLMYDMTGTKYYPQTSIVYRKKK